MTTGMQLAGGVIIATALVLTWVAMASDADKAVQIEIASGGKSLYAIVIPDQADQARIMPAANLLQKTIQETTECNLPIVKESAMPKDAPAIYLGKSQATTKDGRIVMEQPALKEIFKREFIR